MAVTESQFASAAPVPSSDYNPQTLWLFSREVDLAAFLGSALVALALLALGVPLGLLKNETPDWLWICCILLIDVAHVYATAMRVYFVPAEFKQRPWLYSITPLIGLTIALLAYQQGATFFWRGLAYLAVFHFVRQQYGWMALYRNKEGDRSRVGWWIDSLAIYTATIYPLVYWHANLPRRFAWLTADDFVSIPSEIARYAWGFYILVFSAYCIRLVVRWLIYGHFNPGKEIIFFTTAALWYLGIVVFDSDYAFTVTNVITHGVPYMVLVFWVRAKHSAHESSINFPSWMSFLAIVWILAYFEEFLWDVGVWHERSWLFGSSIDWAYWHPLLVPALAVPQITHYILDGFIWRRNSRNLN